MRDRLPVRFLVFWVLASCGGSSQDPPDASGIVDAPVADAPVADAPVADAPVADAPIADASPVDAAPPDVAATIDADPPDSQLPAPTITSVTVSGGTVSELRQGATAQLDVVGQNLAGITDATLGGICL